MPLFQTGSVWTFLDLEAQEDYNDDTDEEDQLDDDFIDEEEPDITTISHVQYLQEQTTSEDSRSLALDALADPNRHDNHGAALLATSADGEPSLLVVTISKNARQVIKRLQSANDRIIIAELFLPSAFATIEPSPLRRTFYITSPCSLREVTTALEDLLFQAFPTAKILQLRPLYGEDARITLASRELAEPVPSTVRPGSFIRLSRGRYKGDLARIVSQTPDELLIQVFPRVYYTPTKRVDQIELPSSWSDRRPPPQPFNYELSKSLGRLVTRNNRWLGTFIQFGPHCIKHGLQWFRLSPTFNRVDFEPTLNEEEYFKWLKHMKARSGTYTHADIWATELALQRHRLMESVVLHAPVCIIRGDQKEETGWVQKMNIPSTFASHVEIQ